MRLLLLLMVYCVALTGVAQVPQQKLHIQITYEKAGQYLEQAVDAIEATSIVGEAAHVEYRAGQSVTMLPGFEARNGSAFLAQIKAVEKMEEATLQLTAFPNPFNQSTTINYYLPADGKVNLWITDSQGRIVGQLIEDEVLSAGNHKIEWKPESIADGVYIPVVESNRQKAVTRIVKK